MLGKNGDREWCRFTSARSPTAEVTGSGKDHLDFTIDRVADSASMTNINADIIPEFDVLAYD
jgi:hypothetical protein